VYESWKADFNTCIDAAPATPEYKLLQLRQYLSGEALKCVQNLGHSAVAYQAAKPTLERKFGGRRRRIAIFIEELDQCRPIREGNSNDVEKFADLLDVAVVNLEDAKRWEELGTGTFLIKLQRKLPQVMLTNYHRWIYENNKDESVLSLRHWVIQEAEFHVIASETIKGVHSSNGDSKQSKNYQRTLHSRNESDSDINQTTKEACVNLTTNIKSHARFVIATMGVWACPVFKALEVSKRLEMVEEKKLCYCCLPHNHLGRTCFRKRKYSFKESKKQHHYLLHEE
jgi:hypothetical protein